MGACAACPLVSCRPRAPCGEWAAAAAMGALTSRARSPFLSWGRPPSGARQARPGGRLCPPPPGRSSPLHPPWQQVCTRASQPAGLALLLGSWGPCLQGRALWVPASQRALWSCRLWAQALESAWASFLPPPMSQPGLPWASAAPTPPVPASPGGGAGRGWSSRHALLLLSSCLLFSLLLQTSGTGSKRRPSPSGSTSTSSK